MGKIFYLKFAYIFEYAILTYRLFDNLTRFWKSKVFLEIFPSVRQSVDWLAQIQDNEKTRQTTTDRIFTPNFLDSSECQFNLTL